jgi:hypothetical protein
MSNWKEEFVESLEGSPSGHSQLQKALVMKEKHMPKHIYRYQPDCDYRRESLANDKIWLSSPDKWNDPYDCEFMISDAAVESAAHKRLEKNFKGNPHQLAIRKSQASLVVREKLSEVRGWRSHCKVCCFNQEPTSMLMWGHYADNHRGFCIEYDLEGPKAAQFRRILYPIVYSDEPYNLTPWAETLVNGSDAFNAEGPILGLIHKFKDWEYEREWRVIKVLPSVEPDHAWAVPTATRVFAGSKMDTANKQVLRTLCESKGIEVLEMHRANDSYELFSAPFSSV